MPRYNIKSFLYQILILAHRNCAILSNYDASAVRVHLEFIPETVKLANIQLYPCVAAISKIIVQQV